MKCIEESSTLYVGNLSFYTSEEQIHSLFSKIGQIKRIIMGLDRNQKTPCGFCFVEYNETNRQAYEIVCVDITPELMLLPAKSIWTG